MSINTQPKYWNGFVPLLRCPLSNEDLTLADEAQIEELYRKIETRDVLQLGKAKVESKAEAYLTTGDSGIYYPVFSDDILGLLPFLAIMPASHEIHDRFLDRGFGNSVRHYYEDVGWQQTEEGEYLDTERSVSMKKVALQYYGWCHARVNNKIPRGEYLLDVASGPIPHDEYLDYHNGFKYRICVDFSRSALELARKKIGEKGIFILGDASALPLKRSSVDTTISLHTVYHIPADLQESAVREFQRVSKKRVIVVYTWDSSLMNGIFSMTRLMGQLRQLGMKRVPVKNTNESREGEPELYIHSHPYQWWKHNWPKSLRTSCWSAVSTIFLNLVPDNIIGLCMLRILFNLEGVFSYFLGRTGSYPMFVLTADESTPQVRQAS
jgi:SAM-dependent methyltransferase